MGYKQRGWAGYPEGLLEREEAYASSLLPFLGSLGLERLPLRLTHMGDGCSEAYRTCLKRLSMNDSVTSI